MVAPSLQDYEYQFDDDGFLINATIAGSAATLPFIDVSKISGLDSPEFRTAQRDHEGVDGGYTDAEFMTQRTITIECIFYADPGDAEDLADTIRYNFRPSKNTRPFYYKHPGKPVRVVYGKSLGARYDVSQLRRWGSTEALLTIACPVPYIYDADVQTWSGNASQVSGNGFGFPISFSLGFGGDAVGDPGGVDITNSGNHVAYPIFRIYGPIAGSPTLVNASTGQQLGFFITLAGGEYLEIDTRKHTVKLNGEVSRYYTLIAGSEWFGIDPGVTSVNLYGTSSPTGQAVGAALGTTTRLITLDADATDIVPGDLVRLVNSIGVLKEPTVFTVDAMNSAFGFTNIDFSPPAQTVTIAGDLVVAGVPRFTAEVRSTWY